jgi:quercetin dioxygenase-like cupin family protein
MSKFNLEKETVKNTDYRRVVETTKNMQLVLMALMPIEDIPEEIHPKTTQFIKVEQGQILVIADGVKKMLKQGQSIIIKPGQKHYVKPKGANPAKLYTIYTPAEHAPGLIQKRQP